MPVSPSKYRVILLIAGIGKRLRPFTYKIPKCLIELKDEKTILDIQLDALSKAGIKETILVVGYYGWKIREMYGSSYKNMKLRYINNPFYAITGGAHSLWLTKNTFKGRPTIIMDGDHVIGSNLIKKLLNSEYENCILVDFDKKELKEEPQLIGQNGLIKYLAWDQGGQLHKHVNSEDCIGEALIIVKLSPKASSILADEVDKHVREGTGILEIITPLNNTFHRIDCWYVPTDGMPWIEIDFKEDLELARRLKI